MCLPLLSREDGYQYYGNVDANQLKKIEVSVDINVAADSMDRYLINRY